MIYTERLYFWVYNDDPHTMIIWSPFPTRTFGRGMYWLTHTSHRFGDAVAGDKIFLWSWQRWQIDFSFLMSRVTEQQELRNTSDAERDFVAQNNIRSKLVISWLFKHIKNSVSKITKDAWLIHINSAFDQIYGNCDLSCIEVLSTSQQVACF